MARKEAVCEQYVALGMYGLSLSLVSVMIYSMDTLNQSLPMEPGQIFIDDLAYRNIYP